MVVVQSEKVLFFCHLKCISIIYGGNKIRQSWTVYLLDQANIKHIRITCYRVVPIIFLIIF